MSNINLRLPEELHEHLRQQAKVEFMTVTQWIIELVKRDYHSIHDVPFGGLNPGAQLALAQVRNELPPSTKRSKKKFEIKTVGVPSSGVSFRAYAPVEVDKKKRAT